MTVRLKDIAQDLGLSTMTISKVLRGKSDVGEETRQRVLKRVQELNYRPNLLAQGLANGQTRTAGLIVPDLVQPFFAEFAKSLASHLRGKGYGLLLASSEDSPEVEAEEFQTLLLRGVDVVILATCRGLRSSARDLLHASTPCVLVDRQLERLKLPYVGSDDLLAGELAAEHLMSLGRSRLAHIGGEHTSTAVDRAQGFVRAIQQAGERIPSNFVVLEQGLEEAGELAGHRAACKLLAAKDQPDALFCYNDLIAIGAIEAVLEKGLRVPEDVAVLGCGNLRYAGHLRVPLSSMDQRVAEMGELAGDVALRVARGDAANSQPVRLAPRLVVRRSTQAGRNRRF